MNGQAAPGVYATRGTDPTADLTGWRNRLNAGEPYGADTQAIVDELSQHHSSYDIDHSQPPAPMLMSSGFTDDLFPADETIRFYNRTKTQYPDADAALFFGDFGHMRGSNKEDVSDALEARIDAWFDHYIKGEGPEPQQGVEAFTADLPRHGALRWPLRRRRLGADRAGRDPIRGRGEQDDRCRLDDRRAVQPGDVAGRLLDASTRPTTAGAAVYRLDAAPAGGYTMMGSATVIADITIPNRIRRWPPACSTSARTTRRRSSIAASGGRSSAARRGRSSSCTRTAGPSPRATSRSSSWSAPTASGPTRSRCSATAVRPTGRARSRCRTSSCASRWSSGRGRSEGWSKAPREKFLPDGYELAADFAALRHPGARMTGKKRIKVKGKTAKVRVLCPEAWVACNDGDVEMVGRVKGKRKKLASGDFSSIAGGKSRTVKVKLTKAAKKSLKSKRKAKQRGRVLVTTAERDEASKKKAQLVGQKKKRKKGGK